MANLEKQILDAWRSHIGDTSRFNISVPDSLFTAGYLAAKWEADNYWKQVKEYHLRDGDICLFFDHDQDDGEISEYWDWSSCGHRSKGNVCWKRAELICKKENREDLK